MVTIGPSAAATGAFSASSSGRNRIARPTAASAAMLASPPEQEIDAMSRPGSGPTTCRSFSASRNSGIERSAGKPSRARKARLAASPPASEAVWLTVAARACSERPTFSATTGFCISRAFAASASKARTSPIPSI